MADNFHQENPENSLAKVTPALQANRDLSALKEISLFIFAYF